MTDRIKVIFPDGLVHPVKPGGYGGNAQCSLPKEYKNLSEAQFKRLSPGIKKEALKIAICNVQLSYFLHVPSMLVPQLVSGWKENPETGKRTIGILKIRKLQAILPDGSKIDIPIDNVTRMGNQGAARAWYAGKEKIFKNLPKKQVESMIREGEGMVGITFSPATNPQEFASLTQKGTPRKYQSHPGTVRGESSKINIARKENPKTPALQRLKKGFYRQVDDPNDPKWQFIQVFIPNKRFKENVGQMSTVCYDAKEWETKNWKTKEPVIAKRDPSLAGECIEDKKKKVTAREGMDFITLKNGKIVYGFWKNIGRTPIK